MFLFAVSFLSFPASVLLVLVVVLHLQECDPLRFKGRLANLGLLK